MKKEGTQSVCRECGGSYYVPPSHRSASSFCSKTCRGAGQSKWQTQDLASRFWAKVDRTGACWLWTAALLKTGYGSIRVDGKAERAHRVAYRLSVGPIPAGLLLRHSCDNPRCVNPAHLIPGTKRDNTQDALDRGQHRVGERDPKCKLSRDAVLTIRAAAALGVSGRFLAQQFGISEAHVSAIKHGKNRAHD